MYNNSPKSINLGGTKAKRISKMACSLEYNFYNFFMENIRPGMNDVEKIRIKCLIFYCCFYTLGIWILTFTAQAKDFFSALVICLLSLLAFFFCKVIKNAYKVTVKEKVTNRLVKYIGNDFSLANKLVIWPDPEIFKSIEMIRTFDGEPEIDDLITGTYKGLPVEIMECELNGVIRFPQKGNNFSLRALFAFLIKSIVCITKVLVLASLFRHNSFQFKGVKSIFTEKLFKGILFTFPIKKINVTTAIVRNRKFLHPLNIGDDINLEDLEFKRIYQTSGFNQIQARILLQPAFMERLKELANKGLKVACCFQIQKAIIAIETKKDMFELPFFRSTKNINCYKEIISQIEDILSIIDTLKLAKK